ncbi:hypothetical protein BgAZ_108030 [Babesia gibsoni]|uniref:Uncharacterized protein n=1 Tax=Babesia gibsoni TaxID=33632 RepID=A0AAD8UUQ7_BABGI|nr:hypothetical protein BgAZ_108030 [Babesia gibsoni]
MSSVLQFLPWTHTRKYFPVSDEGGKRPLISSHLKANLIASGLFAWCIFALYMTYRVMRPEDYAWLDAERERIEAAKEKMKRIIELEKRAKAAK